MPTETTLPAEKVELLPCPFCGGKAAWGEGEQKTRYGNEQAYCTNCYAMTAPEGTKAKAARSWNTRATAQPTPVSATTQQGAPERVWLELERFPDGPEWNVTFRGLPPPAHRVNAVEYVHGDRHAKAIEGLRRLKDAAFTLHVNEKHKPDAFAVCMHPICHEACKSWNEATARAALHPDD